MFLCMWYIINEYVQFMAMCVEFIYISLFVFVLHLVKNVVYVQLKSQ